MINNNYGMLAVLTTYFQETIDTITATFKTEGFTA